MTVPDAQKLAYLQEMGIQAYFPRRALPGARQSLRYSVQSIAQAEIAAEQASRAAIAQAVTPSMTPKSLQESSTQTSLAPSVETQRADGPSSAGLAQAKALLSKASNPVVQNISRPEASAPKQEGVVSPTSAPAELPTAEPSESVNFVFAYFAVNEDIAVINELPWAGSGQVSFDHKELLAKILNAIGVPCIAQSLEPIVFRWPIDGMPENAQSARNMLEGFIARRLKINPARRVLILAEQSARYLFPADYEIDPSTKVSHPRISSEIVLTRSLDAMTASRQVKGVVWEALQPLKASIENAAGSTQNELGRT